MVMTASIQAGFEPIPGYVLRDKLGTGGYGEVWLADAPGGLKKAIKFVHGNIDGNRAAGELKSLQRIRQVNHPFILSLERIEVIEGQLIIVTELAQGSLHDRFIEFRQKGFVGISRDKLLAYMSDTADGLDFLCQQHDLQHLDVKPGNLLLVADRVKVADFGLIKDIQSNSLSVMGGLTPTYAAPEMFDGRPGRFSDQYSLAIVYQELLTGTLPFRGRTTAQLANEHLHKAPNLEAIPLLERPILSKALAKKPQMRFSDCREFIHALATVQSLPDEIKADSSDTATSKKKVVYRSSNKATQLRATGASIGKFQVLRKHSVGPLEPSTESPVAVSSRSRGVEILPELLSNVEDSYDASSIETKDSNNPKKTLIIGLGATGARSLILMRHKLLESSPFQLSSEQLGFLLIDTDQATIEAALAPEQAASLPYHAAVLIPLKSPQYYRQSDADFTQLSRRWVYNIPRSLKTEGVRPLGMLALLDNVTAVFDALHESILEVAKSNGDEAFYAEPVTVQIVASAHGGTGSAIASEIGFMVRQLAAEFEITINTELILTCASQNAVAASELTTASALACLTEINHYFETGGLHPQLDRIPASKAINQPPFDFVSLIYGGQCGINSDWEATTFQVSEYLWACSETDLGDRIARTRLETGAEGNIHIDREWTPWLGAVNSQSVMISSDFDTVDLASRICLRAILPWLSAINEVLMDKATNDSTPKNLDSRTLEKMDFFVQDMFRNNHWTAQAWVRQCMVRLVPNIDEKQIDAAESPQEQPQADSTLSIEQREDIEHVCEQLALEINDAIKSINAMITDTQETLAECLTGRWLVNPVAWANLRPLLRNVGSKFSVNANSLNIVSQKLADKHDAFLERMYRDENNATTEFEQQLHAMALETRFHSMGANMLGRLAEHMSYIENLWINECKMLHSEICNWVDELSIRLGVQLNDSPKANSFLSALFQSEMDDAVSREARKSIQQMMSCRLKVALVPASDTEDVASSTFDAVLEAARKACLPVQAPPASVGDFDLVEEGTTGESEFNNTVLAREPAPTHPVATQSELTSTSNSNVCEALPEKRSLEIEIDSSRPYFVEFGGAVRNVVLVPIEVAERLDPVQRGTIVIKKAALISSDRCQKPTVICLGEQLVLSDIMDRVWMPSKDVWNVSNRILARVDVDWLPVKGPS
jgi:serine/threonine protein kinase